MLGEILGLAPSQPGDEDEVVVVSELLLAQVAEVADPAVVARPRVRLGLGLERAEEPLARAPEVGHVLGGAERLALPGAELDVEALRQLPLDPPELLGVEAELEHVRRLGRARELRVDGLVRAVRLALEEVREPAPGAVGEVRLVDDLRLAGANRLLGEPPRLVGVEALVVVGRDADDRAPLGDEPREVRRLVLVTLAADEVAVRVVDVRPLELAALHLQVQVRQVRAGEVRREVGGREEQRAVSRESHHSEYQLGGPAHATVSPQLRQRLSRTIRRCRLTRIWRQSCSSLSQRTTARGRECHAHRGTREMDHP